MIHQYRQNKQSGNINYFGEQSALNHGDSEDRELHGGFNL